MGTSDQTNVVRTWRPVTFGWHPRWGTLPWAWAFNLWGLHLHVQLCLTLRDPVDCSPPGSSVHEVSRQEFWSGVPFPPPGDLPDPGIEPESRSLLHWQVGSLPLSHLWSPGSALSPDNPALNCRTPSRCLRIAWCGVRLHTSGVRSVVSGVMVWKEEEHTQGRSEFFYSLLYL